LKSKAWTDPPRNAPTGLLIGNGVAIASANLLELVWKLRDAKRKGMDVDLTRIAPGSVRAAIIRYKMIEAQENISLAATEPRVGESAR
jgi:hypothetical protein